MTENSTSATTPGPARKTYTGFFGLFRRLYDWTLSWADTRWGPVALSVLSFTEAVVFPLPPDPLLMALAIGKPKKSMHFAALATASSVAGAVVGYAMGAWLWDSMSGFFFQYIPGFTHEAFAFVQGKYQENAFLTILTAAFTPVPYKIFTIASGVFDVGIPTLVAGSLLGRGGRFFLEAGLLAWLGKSAHDFIDRHFNALTVLFFVLLILGFWAIKKLL